MSEAKIGRKSLIASITAVSLLGGCISKSGDTIEIPQSSGPPTADQLVNAYSSCEVGFDIAGFNVIESGEPKSKVQYTVEAERNSDIATANDAISYRGLVAEISGDATTPGQRGVIEWDEKTGIAVHEFESIDVYGPGSVAYNLFAVAEGDLSPADDTRDQSYRYCGTVAVTGHTNHGMTDVQPVEPFTPEDGVRTVELRPAG